MSAANLTIGSLFSGIGGLELGLERAGLGPVVWQVEKDAYCRAVLAKHWPDATRYEDVKDAGRGNLTPVDVICGGFPCQDISIANVKAKGLAGERSGLWREFARIVRALRPRYVVVENVTALFHRGFGDVLGDLAAIGYDAEWSVLSACAVGAPHTRERVFVVAYPAAGRREQLWRAIAPADVRARHIPVARRGVHSRRGTAWESEPALDRVAYGVSGRVAAIGALGNAVVPQVAEVVGHVVLALEAERLATEAA